MSSMVDVDKLDRPVRELLVASHSIPYMESIGLLKREFVSPSNYEVQYLAVLLCSSGLLQ